MRGVWSFLAILLHYVVQNAKIKASYPWDFFVEILGTITYGAMNILFLWTLIQHIPRIMGYDFPRLVFLYGFGEMSFGLFSFFLFGGLVRFSEYYLVEGNLDRVLLRPLPVLAQVVMEWIEVFDTIIWVKGIALMSWALWVMDTPLDLGFVAALVGALILAAAVYSGVFLAAAALSFWLPDRGGLMMPLYSLSDVSRYPITAYPLPVRLFFSYLIPFAYVAFVPCEWLFGPATETSWMGLGRLLIAAVLTLGIGIGLFLRGLRHYESTGS